MTTCTVNSDTSLQECIGNLREDYRVHKFVRVTTKTGKDRSLPQNNFSHAWYEQLGRELKEYDALGWKCYSKLHFGVPILRMENEEFKQAYDSAIKGLQYEQKIQVMKILPVTSLMTKAQISAYLEAIQDYFLPLGVFLKFPDEVTA